MAPPLDLGPRLVVTAIFQVPAIERDHG